MLESLTRIFKYSFIATQKYSENFRKGLEFYFNNQFNVDGWSYWRIPKKWPIDIHNQSQGIITFSWVKSLDDKYGPFANKIAQWTIKNMQGRSGNFYYQKWPVINNKVNYLRWNQA